MEQFISEKKISIYQGLNVDILTIKENNKYYYDIYNMINDEVYFIGRFEIDPFVYFIDYEVNGSYLLVYHYEPVVGTDKSVVTKVLKFYDLIENISIIDSVDNIIDQFASSYLVKNPSKLCREKYIYPIMDKNLKSKSLNVITRFEFNEYLIVLKSNSLGIKKQNSHNQKVICLSDYINTNSQHVKIKTKL